MGCCCSKRLESTTEKGLSGMSTKSLRSEIDSNAISPGLSRTRKKTKQLPRIKTGRSNNLYSQPSSPGHIPRLETLKAVSTRTSRTSSPTSLSTTDFSQSFLKTPIRNNYTTVRKLHKGFYGDTLLAVDNRTDIKKVIKEFKKSVIPAEAHEKFIKEIQKFQCLDHPNVVKLIEVYESRQSWFLVYEFFSGSNLLDTLNYDIIGISLAWLIMQDILSGLNYCHRNRVFHFGLNLERIILDSKEGKINCKIMGFSNCLELSDLVKINEVTCYMAPEVLSGVYNKAASDVWSLGVILYSILQGKPPFQCKGIEGLLNEYKKELDLNEENWLFASNDLKDLIIKMLEYDYNKRITVEEALNHPWIKNNQSLTSLPASNGAISRLMDFTTKDKIARKLFSFFKVNLASQNDQREFIEIFKKLDTNKDGQISNEELLNEAKNLDTKLQNRLKRILKNADLMEKGYIEYSEFLTACTDWNTDENIKKFEKAFKLCDKSGDGQLSLKEMKASIKGVKHQEWAEFFGNVDIDQSGNISLEELKQFLFGEKLSIKKQEE